MKRGKTRGGADDVRQHVLSISRDVDASTTQDRRAQRRAQRGEQIEEGRCNVVPLPRVATQPFRTELTVEQNSLFVSNSYKGDHFERELTVTNPDSEEKVLRRLVVGKVDDNDRGRGVLTQYHQDVFYKVLQLWGGRGYQIGEVNGRPYGQLTISSYELVVAIRGNDGAAHYKRVRRLLQDLMAIPVTLENVYTWQGLQDREQFTLLSEVRWSERGLDRKTGRPRTTGSSEVTILLSSFVTEGFLHKHMKLLLGKPYEELGAQGKGRRGEMARLLYPFLDAQLARKGKYKAKLVTLIERFAFKHYEYKSKRREKFLPAARALHGKPIQEGRFQLSVRIELSADESDYMLVVERVPSGQLGLFEGQP